MVAAKPLWTEQEAGRIVQEFVESGNLIKFALDCSHLGSKFGRFTKYNRELFEHYLTKELQVLVEQKPADNSAAGNGAQGSEHFHALFKWIEERSLDLADEEDAKHLLWKIIGDSGVSAQAGGCFMCTVQDKVHELGEGELQEVSDICLSELDRREEKVPRIKTEEVEP